MKIIRTSNLNVAFSYLVGGQMDTSGNCSEGFQTLTHYNELMDSGFVKNGVIDCNAVKNSIQNLLDCADEFAYKYYDDRYKFKKLSDKKIIILAKKCINNIKLVLDLEQSI